MRVHGWQENLLEQLELCKAMPFSYPTHDCCTFAARCVDAIVGGNRYAELATKYYGRDSAYAYIAECGGLEQAVSAWMGPSMAPNAAGPGDVILAHADLGPTIGICLGLNCVFAFGDGLAYRNRSVISRCWRVD